MIKRMRSLLQFVLVVPTMAFSQTTGRTHYHCETKWTTLTENLPAIKIKWHGKTKQKIKEGVTLELESQGLFVRIHVKEDFKNEPNNFIRHSFSCDKNLNCEGSQEKHYNGKLTAIKMETSPGSTTGVGQIEGKVYFRYSKLSPTKFEYQYVTYMDELDHAYGLKVLCHE